MWLAAVIRKLGKGVVKADRQRPGFLPWVSGQLSFEIKNQNSCVYRQGKLYLPPSSHPNNFWRKRRWHVSSAFICLGCHKNKSFLQFSPPFLEKTSTIFQRPHNVNLTLFLICSGNTHPKLSVDYCAKFFPVGYYFPSTTACLFIFSKLNSAK